MLCYNEKYCLVYCVYIHSPIDGQRTPNGSFPLWTMIYKYLFGVPSLVLGMGVYWDFWWFLGMVSMWEHSVYLGLWVSHQSNLLVASAYRSCSVWSELGPRSTLFSLPPQCVLLWLGMASPPPLQRHCSGLGPCSLFSGCLDTSLHDILIVSVTYLGG